MVKMVRQLIEWYLNSGKSTPLFSLQFDYVPSMDKYKSKCLNEVEKFVETTNCSLLMLLVDGIYKKYWFEDG